MGRVDPVDDRTFNVSFTSDGVAKLREVVKEKLMEFTDFSDDHLVVRTFLIFGLLAYLYNERICLCNCYLFMN